MARGVSFNLIYFLGVPQCLFVGEAILLCCGGGGGVNVCLGAGNHFSKGD